MEPQDGNDLGRMLLERKIGLIENLGLFALKMLLTLNSGATVVLLALLGNLQDGAPALAVDVAAIQSAMIWFFAGILCVMLAIAVTYVIAQLDAARWPRGLEIATGLHLALMVLPAAGSFAAFGIGFLRATFAFGAP